MLTQYEVPRVKEPVERPLRAQTVRAQLTRRRRTSLRHLTRQSVCRMRGVGRATRSEEGSQSLRAEGWWTTCIFWLAAIPSTTLLRSQQVNVGPVRSRACFTTHSPFYFPLALYLLQFQPFGNLDNLATSCTFVAITKATHPSSLQLSSFFSSPCCLISTRGPQKIFSTREVASHIPSGRRMRNAQAVRKRYALVPRYVPRSQLRPCSGSFDGTHECVELRQESYTVSGILRVRGVEDGYDMWKPVWL